MNQSKIIIICLIILVLISLSSQINDYELLVEWGKNNSLTISDKLQMKYSSENNKTFYAKEKILKDETLLIIPNSMSLNIKNAIKLYGKKVQKLYKEFKLNCKNLKNDFMCEQAFISYLMYKVNKNNKTKSNNLYKYFQYLFNTFESNLDSFPLFYNMEQRYLIQFTSLAYSINFIKKLYQGEIDIFENKLNLKEINKDEYYVFRTYASSKSYNISGHSVIVPFIDMFNKHPTDYNLRVVASENETRILATRDILPFEILFVKYDYLTNQNALSLFGITFPEIINKVNSLHVPVLNPLLLKNHEIDTNKDSSFNKYFREFMDIAKDKFYIKFIEKYKQILNELDEDNTELSALKLILENLETLVKLNSAINSSHIHKVFLIQKDIDNILRIFSGEIKFLNEKIKQMKEIINKYANNKEINDL